MKEISVFSSLWFVDATIQDVFWNGETISFQLGEEEREIYCFLCLSLVELLPCRLRCPQSARDREIEREESFPVLPFLEKFYQFSFVRRVTVWEERVHLSGKTHKTRGGPFLSLPKTFLIILTTLSGRDKREEEADKEEKETDCLISFHFNSFSLSVESFHQISLFVFHLKGVKRVICRCVERVWMDGWISWFQIKTLSDRTKRISPLPSSSRRGEVTKVVTNLLCWFNCYITDNLWDLMRSLREWIKKDSGWVCLSVSPYPVDFNVK